MRYRVVYSPGASEDIRELKAYLTEKAGKRIAARYIRRLKDFCKELENAPHVGEQRVGLTQGQRSIGFEHRVSVVFELDDVEYKVRLAQFDYAGRESHRTH